jgi:proteasome lid subunit RPN8/RPN11
MPIIALPDWIRDTILARCNDIPHAEICGLLARQNSGDYSHYPVNNCASNPAERYEMEPRELITAMRHMRERAEVLFAIYHSHPFSQPIASRIDIDEAQYPDALYLIASPHAEPPLRAFQIRDKTAQEMHLIWQGH